MKQYTRSPGLRPLAAAVLAVGTFAVAGQAQAANTAATATIRNQVTVSYANAVGTTQPNLTAFADVKVNLVAAAPTITNITTFTAPDTASALTTDPSTAALYTYRVVNNSNGRVAYTFTASKTSDTTDGGNSTVTASSGIELGASVIVTALASTPSSGNFAITVPRDDVADSSVNGIAAGDFVVIGGRTFEVNSVNDQQVAGSPPTSPVLSDYTTTITLISDGGTGAIAAGSQVGERGEFTSTVTPGTITTAGDKTIGGQVVVSDNDPASVPVAGAAIASTTDVTLTTTTTVAGVGLTVQKLVFNVDSGVPGTGAATHCGVTAYAGGVTANPGETLQYLIVVSKNASPNVAKGVKVSDPIPPFTTLVSGSLQIDDDGDGAGAFAAIDETADSGDAGEVSATTVYFYPGTGGDDTAAGAGNGTGGQIAASGKVCMSFQVLVD